MAEVALTADGRYTFKKIETGEEVNVFASVYDDVHIHDLVQEYHYEIAYLRVPSFDVMALWLRGDDHHHEMMIPLASAQSHLEAGVSYSARAFMHIVEAIARERIMQEDMHIAVDDLAPIEGIGPKIAELLIQADIFTFADLAKTASARLQEILQDGGPRYNRADPITWPEQAALARDGDWSALETLKDELRGGKRTETAHKPGATFDDLTRIKGINTDRAIYFDETIPRYREETAEYATFEMLSKLSPADFAEMMNIEEANLNSTLVDSWPKQAELAATGKWDELKKYQATLPEWKD